MRSSPIRRLPAPHTRVSVSIYNIYRASIHSYLYLYVFIRLDSSRDTVYVLFTIFGHSCNFRDLGVMPFFFSTTGAGDMQNTVRSHRTLTHYTSFDNHVIRTACISAKNTIFLNINRLLFDITNDIILTFSCSNVLFFIILSSKIILREKYQFALRKKCPINLMIA